LPHWSHDVAPVPYEQPHTGGVPHLQQPASRTWGTTAATRA